VQDIFLSVAQQLTQFRYDRPQHTFRGWLRVIAQRRISDYFRRTSNRPLAEGGTTAFRFINQYPDPLADDPDAESEEADLSHRALELIRSDFEPKTWAAFHRTAIDAASPAEVAEELSMAPAAVRMAKSRVLSRLRQELAGIVAWPDA
jgi:RNA polymerase sigma-70 factor (ECF subfamily)